MSNTQELFKKMIVKTHNYGSAKLWEYLMDTDFFTAPASTRYHGSYEGGLLEHTVNVVYEMIQLNKYYELGLSEESIILVGMCHDLCKVNTYVEATVNVPPDRSGTGKWEKAPGYRKDEVVKMGHGAKSLSIAQDYLQLTTEEKQAIYWHMGAFDISPYSSVGDMSCTYNSNKLAFLLHLADMVCTYIVEVD